MADKDRKRALFRAKLNEKQKKRIDSPLVRYNEYDKPVCRVCDVVLKSDSDWRPHQASRKHHEAINNLKANASKKNVANNSKSEVAINSPKHQQDDSLKSIDAKLGTPSDAQKARSPVLPADFFDSKETKRQKFGSAEEQAYLESAEEQRVDASTGAAPSTTTIFSHDKVQPTRVAENVIANSGTKLTKGALPEGFFDNKEADLRARGIEPIKPDVKDEYKEFEKLIQEDLVEVDNRLEEEEIDAAELIEEEEMVEQRTYRDRVELLKKKKVELLAARSSKNGGHSKVAGMKSDQDESSSEDEDESFAVDWRAQHL